MTNKLDRRIIQTLGKSTDLIEKLKEGIEKECVVHRLDDQDRPDCCAKDSPVCGKCPVLRKDMQTLMAEFTGGRVDVGDNFQMFTNREIKLRVTGGNAKGRVQFEIRTL
ncbi:hypothetical protein KBC75_06370 [Candidatus Shapirobacteria bacterium]|nr:hypothetical protein [Candidatus Shapirobacteria bacterium]